MALEQDLLETARKLANANQRRPKQADLRRAVSTAYYAVFHALAHECADRFIGTGDQRSEAAWTQVYRALEHGFAAKQARKARELGFPDPRIPSATSVTPSFPSRRSVTGRTTTLPFRTPRLTWNLLSNLPARR